MIFTQPAKSRMFEQSAGSKSLLLLFFRKEESSFSEKEAEPALRKAKRLYFLTLRRDP
jgi:hypothetical protein